jgi:hypothetical protein
MKSSVDRDISPLLCMSFEFYEYALRNYATLSSGWIIISGVALLVAKVKVIKKHDAFGNF